MAEAATQSLGGGIRDEKLERLRLLGNVFAKEWGAANKEKVHKEMKDWTWRDAEKFTQTPAFATKKPMTKNFLLGWIEQRRSEDVAYQKWVAEQAEREAKEKKKAMEMEEKEKTARKQEAASDAQEQEPEEEQEEHEPNHKEEKGKKGVKKKATTEADMELDPDPNPEFDAPLAFGDSDFGELTEFGELKPSFESGESETASSSSSSSSFSSSSSSPSFRSPKKSSKESTDTKHSKPRFVESKAVDAPKREEEEEEEEPEEEEPEAQDLFEEEEQRSKPRKEKGESGSRKAERKEKRDREQHLEMTKEFSRRMEEMYAENKKLAEENQKLSSKILENQDETQNAEKLLREVAESAKEKERLNRASLSFIEAETKAIQSSSERQQIQILQSLQLEVERWRQRQEEIAKEAEKAAERKYAELVRQFEEYKHKTTISTIPRSPTLTSSTPASFSTFSSSSSSTSSSSSSSSTSLLSSSSPLCSREGCCEAEFQPHAPHIHQKQQQLGVSRPSSSVPLKKSVTFDLDRGKGKGKEEGKGTGRGPSDEELEHHEHKHQHQAATERGEETDFKSSRMKTGQRSSIRRPPHHHQTQHQHQHHHRSSVNSSAPHPRSYAELLSDYQATAREEKNKLLQQMEMTRRLGGYRSKAPLVPNQAREAYDLFSRAQKNASRDEIDFIRDRKKLALFCAQSLENVWAYISKTPNHGIRGLESVIATVLSHPDTQRDFQRLYIKSKLTQSIVSGFVFTPRIRLWQDFLAALGRTWNIRNQEELLEKGIKGAKKVIAVVRGSKKGGKGGGGGGQPSENFQKAVRSCVSRFRSNLSRIFFHTKDFDLDELIRERNAELLNEKEWKNQRMKERREVKFVGPDGRRQILDDYSLGKHVQAMDVLGVLEARTGNLYKSAMADLEMQKAAQSLAGSPRRGRGEEEGRGGKRSSSDGIGLTARFVREFDKKSSLSRFSSSSSSSSSSFYSSSSPKPKALPKLASRPQVVSPGVQRPVQTKTEGAKPKQVVPPIRERVRSPTVPLTMSSGKYQSSQPSSSPKVKGQDGHPPGERLGEREQKERGGQEQQEKQEKQDKEDKEDKAAKGAKLEQTEQMGQGQSQEAEDDQEDSQGSDQEDDDDEFAEFQATRSYVKDNGTGALSNMSEGAAAALSSAMDTGKTKRLLTQFLDRSDYTQLDSIFVDSHEARGKNRAS